MQKYILSVKFNEPGIMEYTILMKRYFHNSMQFTRKVDIEFFKFYVETEPCQCRMYSKQLEIFVKMSGDTVVYITYIYVILQNSISLVQYGFIVHIQSHA